MFPSTRKKCHVWRCLFASLIVGLLWKSLYTVVTKCLLLRLDTVCCVTEEVSLFGCCSRFDLARNLITLEHSTCTLSPTPLHLVTLNIHRKSSGSVIMVFFGLKFKKFRECFRWQSLRKGERERESNTHNWIYPKSSNFKGKLARLSHWFPRIMCCCSIWIPN